MKNLELKPDYLKRLKRIQNEKKKKEEIRALSYAVGIFVISFIVVSGLV